jgi:hypothetical protein
MKEASTCKILEPSISRGAYREFLRYLYTGKEVWGVGSRFSISRFGFISGFGAQEHTLNPYSHSIT